MNIYNNDGGMFKYYASSEEEDGGGDNGNVSKPASNGSSYSTPLLLEKGSKCSEDCIFWSACKLMGEINMDCPGPFI